MTLLLILLTLPLVLGDADLDRFRTVSYYTDYPIYRSGSGSNTVKVLVGKPAAEVQLTLSTNVNFIQVASCAECTNGKIYDPAGSNTWTVSFTLLKADESNAETQVNVIVYPQFPEDTLTLTSRLGTDIVLDSRGQDQVKYPVSAVDQVESGRDGQGGGSGQAVRLGAGVSGFFGLGINQQNRQQSIVANMLNADNYPPNQPVTNNFFVGFDISTYSNQVGARVGSMHWGAAPQGKWVGEFNWLETNRTVGGSWGIPISNIRMGGNVAETTSLYASIDPGFDGIFVPTRVAETLFANIQGARRDTEDPRRWTIPCNFIQSMSISILTTTYNINPTQLVQPKVGATCYSHVQAWTNGSVAEEQGEIRLGTTFMSGVYSAIYYSPNQQFVALAGKPGSVNDFDVAAPTGGGTPNLRLAGILIGTLLGSLLVLFILCYARNRSSFQSIWARGARRIQRAQMNAVIRGTTIPPPMMAVPGMGPMTMGAMGPMGMGVGPGMMGPGMMGPGMMGPGMMGPGPLRPMGYGPMGMGQMGMSHPGVPMTGQGGAGIAAPGHVGEGMGVVSNGQMAMNPVGLGQVGTGQAGRGRAGMASTGPGLDNLDQRGLNHADRRRRSKSPSMARREGGFREVHPIDTGQCLPAYKSHSREQTPPTPPKQSQSRHHSLPTALPHQPQGYYSPRTGAPHPSTHERNRNRHSAPQHAESLLNNRYPVDIPLRPHLEETNRATYAGHRFSRPEYEHAPPGSATTQSLWQFGKAKAKSVARGYGAVPRHASTFEIAGDSSSDHPTAPVDANGRGTDWKAVERNREKEGLTASRAWGR